MADEDDGEENQLVGVKLLAEKTTVEPLPLGVIVLSKDDLAQQVSSLRHTLRCQLKNLPQRYNFLSYSRCPLEEGQELQVKVRQLVSNNTIFIKPKYDKPKIGVTAKSDVSLGFVFADFGLPLPQLRSVINTEIPFFADVANIYHFLDRNGWPVGRNVESHFTVMDVYHNGSVRVGADHFSPDIVSPAHLPAIGYSPDGSPPDKRRSDYSHRVEKEDQPIDMEHAATLRHFASSASTLAKQLLISYVRAEAAQHALLLKQLLSKKGFSVYLDVHEIKSGVDWQDSLNYAVSNCEVFIPLVTPLYGETQWTNREVKLADVLGKHILPISFLEVWPPRCLAIQFATTQYICWKTPEQIHSEEMTGRQEIARDIRVWEEGHASRVASEIGERLHHLRRGGSGEMPSTPSLQRRKTLMKTFCKLPSNFLALDGEEDTQTNGHRKQFAVICAHPNERKQAEDLENWLENQGCSVWCSSQEELSQSDILPEGQYNICKRSEIDKSKALPVSVQTFQTQADEADVVIVLLSTHFIQSRTCIQQVFYCEHRKQMVPVKIEDFKMPCWLNMLIGDSKVLDIDKEDFKASLLAELKQLQAPHHVQESNAEARETKILNAVKHLKHAFCKKQCVYISGATSIKGKHTKAICRAIGQALAGLDNLTLVTAGQCGVGKLTTEAFHDSSTRGGKKNAVVHVLLQRKNKTGQEGEQESGMLPYAKTMASSDNAQDHETIVASSFDICLMIEGGPDTVCEVENFVWNDCIVIPVQWQDPEESLPKTVVDAPQGVDSGLWCSLNKADLSPEFLGQAVFTIISSLLSRLGDEGRSIRSPPLTPPQPPPRTNRPHKISPPGPRPKLASMKTIILG